MKVLRWKIWPNLLVGRSIILFLWAATIALLIITFLVILYKVRGSTAVALHYNIVTGADVLGSPRNFYKLPLTGLLLAALNYLLYQFIADRNSFLSLAAAAISCVMALIILAAAILLLQI